ncbi:MAG: methylamine utilization protein [Calditrichaeota bacterium]|nr:methylamine utilization protein [Calditrichota bacterium]
MKIISMAFSTALLVLIWVLNLTAGEITGTVTVKGAADNGGAVVFIVKNKGMTFPAPKQEPAMNQKNLKFTPHVLAVMVGTTVKFKNNDKVAHNIFTPSPAGDRFNLGTWKGNQVKTHTFTKSGEVVLLCNLHPEMEGFIYVAPTPYFAKTDAAGRYKIENVPAGSYTLKVWSEYGNARPQKVTVPEKGTVTANFMVK